MIYILSYANIFDEIVKSLKCLRTWKTLALRFISYFRGTTLDGLLRWVTSYFGREANYPMSSSSDNNTASATCRMDLRESMLRFCSQR